MKFSTTTLALCAAPLALAKAVHNAYPGKRDSVLAQRNPQTPSSLALELQGLGLSGLGVSSNAATEVIIIWVNPGNGAATTNVNNPMGAGAGASPPTGAPGATGVAAAPASAATHQVTVGGNAGLIYTPSQIQAAVGDMVVFTFMSTNHTATQSSFDTPCVAMPGGMDSGFQPNVNNTVNPPPQVAMQVMVATPLWFYCKQKGHCGKGMTFSINPTAAKTQAMFQSMAIAQNGTGSPTAITGGSANNGTAAPPSGSGSSAGTGTAQTGTGTIQGGQCQCAVTCAVGALPANVQGLGAFGGMTGSLPMAMSEPMLAAAGAS